MLKAKLYHYSQSLVHGFRFKNQTYLPDFKVNLLEYEHEKSKARLVHLSCDDENKAFASAFRSQVENSRGTPHILEHIICCGSEKYPVRDPFMAMAKRSLNTYMNAWTGPDFIAFPFASVNDKDFQNLLDVYLDLVFRPQLKNQDFRQEGWRLNIEGDQPEIKGVVYNEMKGVCQSSENMFHQYILDHVMHGTEYAYNYGGDPVDILQLKHQELIDYYKRTFDSSASIFYLYGNQDIKMITNKLDKYLGNHVQSQIKQQTLQSLKPKDILPLPPSVDDTGNNKQAQLSFSYALKSQLIKDPVKSLAFSVIQSVLFEPFAGLLYKELIDTGLVESFGKMAGSEIYGKFSIFNFAFQGVDHDRKSVEKIQKVIQKVLKQLVDEGFPEDMVEGALHQTEISTKMPNSEQGLRLLDYVLPALLHNQDIIQPFNVSATISELKEKIKNGYLEQIIKEEFIHNNSQTIIYAQPEQDYLKKLQQKETDTVQNIYNSLSNIQKAETKSLNTDLAFEQDKQQDLSVLPTLNLSDIPIKQPSVRYNKTEYSNIPIFYVQESTNGMTFLKLKFNLGTITNGLRQYLSMFCTFLTKVGTQELRNEEITKMLNLNATGFDASFDSYNDPQNEGQIKTHITISIACLDSKLDSMFDVLTQILTDPLFMDRENVSSVFRNQSVSYQSDLLENSLHYAMNLTNKNLTENSYITDLNFSTKFFLNYATKFNKVDPSGKTFYLDDFNFQMTSILNHVMKQHRINVLVHTQIQDRVDTQLQKFIDALKQKYEGFTIETNDNFIDKKHAFKPSFIKQATILPSQVNFVVQGHNIPGFSHSDTAPLYVLGTLLSNTYLHKEIREKGGAYGSGCSVQPMKGVMNMWSYRDPNILETLNTFERINLDEMEDKDLNEAKFSIFQKLDRPKDPQSKGVEETFYGITPKMQEDVRERILNTNLDEVKRVFDAYWLASLKNSQCSYGIFSNQEHSDISKLKEQGYKVEQFLQ